jgi:hypothetical protein
MISFGLQGTQHLLGLSVVLSLAGSLLLVLCCNARAKDEAGYVLCVVSHSYHCHFRNYVWLCRISTAPSRHLGEEVTVISSVKISWVASKRRQGSQMSAPRIHSLSHLG